LDVRSETLALPGWTEFEQSEIQLVRAIIDLKHTDPFSVDLDDLSGLLDEALGEHPPLSLGIPAPDFSHVFPEHVTVKCERPFEIGVRNWSQTPDEVPETAHCIGRYKDRCLPRRSSLSRRDRRSPRYRNGDLASYRSDANSQAVRFARNPYRRAAACFMFVAVMLSIAGAAVLNLVAWGVAVTLAFVAYARRDSYPR
jgi:hypothetical protein